MSICPTLLVYGTPPDYSFFSEFIDRDRWGLVLDNGRARDPVFTIYENLARADALMCFPDAQLVHLVSVMAEAEVGHPLIVKDPGTRSRHFLSKPMVFLGNRKEWEPFLQVFSRMREQGLTRESFDRLVHYASSYEEARAYIVANLPAEAPSTRLHYYLHALREADTEINYREGVSPSVGVTVACFGSASTKSREHLSRAQSVAQALVRQQFCILHGGGANGVMGELTKAGARLNGFVKGVTVDENGAPKIFFERAENGTIPEEVDLRIASKDMLHRIESYAGNSEAFVSLDGGIGSVQEVLVIAELRAQKHPVIMFDTTEGKRVAKPLWLLNEGGIYTPLLNYLEEQGALRLRNEIQVAATVAELEDGLVQFFAINKPVVVSNALEFRENYGQVVHPTARLRV